MKRKAAAFLMAKAGFLARSAATLALLGIAGASPAKANVEDEAYFRQFLYRVDRDMSDPEFPGPSTYWFPGTSFGFKVPLSESEDLLVRLYLFMRADGTYEARYRDWTQQRGAMYFYARECKVLRGEWSVPARELELRAEGVVWATVGRDFVDGRHALRIFFREGLGIREAKDVSTTMTMAQSAQDPLATPACFP